MTCFSLHLSSLFCILSYYNIKLSDNNRMRLMSAAPLNCHPFTIVNYLNTENFIKI